MVKIEQKMINIVFECPLGVLDAVPLDENLQQDGVWSNHSVAFDALMEFADYTELEATQYIFDFFGHLTTGVSLMNPGWEQVGSGLDHELKRYAQPMPAHGPSTAEITTLSIFIKCNLDKISSQFHPNFM